MEIFNCGGTLTIGYTDIKWGIAGIYNIEGASVTDNGGNMNYDPLLVPDLHLKAGSPCIDHGDDASAPQDDIDAETRPQGSGCDMGADEFYDSDSDGMPNYWEDKYGLNPWDSSDSGLDGDNDGLSNLVEYENDTDPNTPDTDSDGFNDGVELAAGTDPNDPGDYPGRVLHVKTDGSDMNTGFTWDQAFATIQKAIDTAEEGCEIRVAQGNYSLSSTINVNKAVAIYGGFTGTEQDDQRDWKNHVTTVDGQGSGHSCFDITRTATIDGFAITGGSPGINEHRSGIITNCMFYGNICGVVISNCTFPTITNCTFYGNNANYGGAIYNFCLPASQDITNGIYDKNIIEKGDAMFNFEVSNSSQTTTVTNCTFYENSATTQGGAIFNCSVADTVVTNCIFWGNTAPEGPQIYDYIDDTTVSYCDIDQDGYAGSNGNIRHDPSFVDPENGDFHLQEGSLCIDAGTESAPALPDADFEGDPRIIDGDGDDYVRVDMGADEYLLDADGDGIDDSIDTDSANYSSDFSDIGLSPLGKTTGSIIDRGNQRLSITEEASPLGIRITAAPSGGTTPAIVSVCGEYSLEFTAGDETVVTCGSAAVQVVVGPVEVKLDGGVVVEVSTGAEVTVTEVSHGQFDIRNSGSSGTIIVVIPGDVKNLDPGENMVVEIYEECEGDFDYDADVDGSDLATFAADFGRTDCGSGPLCEGDFDTDGDVDGSDLAVFAADFGRTDCP